MSTAQPPGDYPDAIMLVSFGGPEGPDEVMPFLQRVTAGRNVPLQRLEEVAQHYYARGGISPINTLNRQLQGKLRAELDRRELEIPVLWGNRNAAPYIDDALSQAASLGAERICVLATSAYPSYSSCRQYREDVAAAMQRTGLTPTISKVAPFALRDGFLEAATDQLIEAADRLDGAEVAPRVLFVTHSIPDVMDELSGPGDGPGRAYSRTHVEVANAVLDRAAARGLALEGELVFCSRSGPPNQPWLEPDINDRMRELAETGVTSVLIHPIGFVSDHMEVVHDLDTEAQETASELGMAAIRVGTVGTHPALISSLIDAALAPAAPCAPGCCPNLREHLPAIAEATS